MSRIIPVRIYPFAALFVLALAGSSFTQPPSKVQPSSEPGSNPRNVKPEKNNAHKKWVSEDVSVIITADEKKAFEALQTDDERENFIDTFWRRRDPDPDTEVNEYREEYYERIAYANEHFASGIPGWKTDRGRIYIAWGKPDSVESRPAGGSYDRPSWEGGGSTTTYPFEIWHYRHLDGVGDGIDIEFVDRTGTGEYRIARNPSEKDALAMVPGGGGFRPDAGTNRENNYMREQDMPFSILRKIAALDSPPAVKFTDLQASLTDTPLTDNNPLEFDLRVDMFRQSEGRVVAAFTLQTFNKELQFVNEGGIETARMNIFGRITAVSGKRTGIFEDSVVTTAASSELPAALERHSIYQKAYTLTPGTYKVEVVVRDVGTGSRGTVTRSFTVPRYDEKKLATSTMILASKLRAAETGDIGGMFVIGNVKVIPNLAETYKQGQEIGVYLQIYNAGIDQTTLKPSVDVEYILSRGGKEVLRQKEDWSGISDAGRRLTLARFLPTSGLPAGEYEVRIVTKDRVGGEGVENKAAFSLVK